MLQVKYIFVVLSILFLECLGLFNSQNCCHAQGKSNTKQQIDRSRVPDYKSITGHVESAQLPLKKPQVLWKFSLEDESISLTDVAVADRTIYVGSEKGDVFALDTVNCSVIWQYEGNARISSTPSIDKQHVYFGSSHGLTAVHRQDGELVWHLAITGGANESTPLPIGDRVYASGYDGKAYALDRDTGEVLWEHDFIEDAPVDQPGFPGEQARVQDAAARPRGSASDGDIFIQGVFDQSRLVAIDCITGKRRWAFQAKGWIGPAPTIVDDLVYIGCQDHHLYCLNRDSGEVVWQFKASSWLSSRVAVHNHAVYLPCHNGKLYMLDAKSGKLINTFTTPHQEDSKSHAYSFPIVTNDSIYFALGTGQLYAIDSIKNTLLWNTRCDEHSELYTDPKTDGQLIFVTSRQNNGQGTCAVFALGDSP